MLSVGHNILPHGLSNLINRVASMGHGVGAMAAEAGQQQHHTSQLTRQIQTAVTTALQNAKTSGQTTDPNTVVTNAILQVLQQNKAANGTSAAQGTDATQESSMTAPDAATATSQQAFLTTLKSYGINPQQLHSDFLNALKQFAGGSGGNPMTVLKSVPPGLLMDMLG